MVKSVFMTAGRSFASCLLWIAISMALAAQGRRSSETGLYEGGSIGFPCAMGVKTLYVGLRSGGTHPGTYPIPDDPDTIRRRTPTVPLLLLRAGPSPALIKEGYIFVFQGCGGAGFMSEGDFKVDDAVPEAARKRPADVDESTDTYDTIEWPLDKRPAQQRPGGHVRAFPILGSTRRQLSRTRIPRSRAGVAAKRRWRTTILATTFTTNGAFLAPPHFQFHKLVWTARASGPTTAYPPGLQSTQAPTTGTSFFLQTGPIGKCKRQVLP